MEALNIAMIHSHLPTLEGAGLIEWDTDASTISKGHRFDDIRPALELMDNPADELPEHWI